MATDVLESQPETVVGGPVDGPDPAHKKGYRWDIQGMRAVAVVLVLLSHANVPGFSGGFIGVDVFFVISGFLITGLLLADASKHHRVGFAHFYSRRARRILPAATVVIIATSIASVLIMNTYQARATIVDSVWAGFFAANVHYASQGTNYFTAALSTVSPLQHYWSLSVEEQFYVVWPALLALVAFGAVAWRRRSAQPSDDLGRPAIVRIAVVLAALGAVSLLFSIHDTATDPHAAYFSTIDRAWELVVGALLAVTLPLMARVPARLRAVCSWAGLAGIAVAAVTFTAASPVPGWITLLPVLSAAAVIAGGVGAPPGSTVSLLSTRPFKFLGGISYSLYLWHWPILILAAAYFPFPLNLAQRVGLLLIAVVVSVLSYTFIETPFQHGKLLTGKRHAGLRLWPIALGMIIVVALVAQPSSAFVGGNGPAVRGLSAATAVKDAVQAAKAGDPIPKVTSPSVLLATKDLEYIGRCSAWKHATSLICEEGDPAGRKTIAVFGNSHSNMWIPTVTILAKQAKWKFFPVVKEACGYDDYAALRGIGQRNQCVVWYHWALAQLRRMHPDVLVVGVYGFRQWAQGLSILLPQLKQVTRRLVLIGDAPGIAKIPGYCLSQPRAILRTCMFPESRLRINDTATARSLAISEHIGFVDPEPWFCYKRQCPSVINGIIPYYDNGHLTRTYARYLAPTLGAKLDLTGKRPSSS